jgi:hypothetical protein
LLTQKIKPTVLLSQRMITISRGAANAKGGNRRDYWRPAEWRSGVSPLGSKADIAALPGNVRFTPKSGHWNSARLTAVFIFLNELGRF